MGKKKVIHDKETQDRFDKLCAMPQSIMFNEDVAKLLDTTVETLNQFTKKNFKCTLSEYRKTKAVWLKELIFQGQVGRALKGDRTLLIWLGKQYLGQSDKTVFEDASRNVPAHIVKSRIKEIMNDRRRSPLRVAHEPERLGEPGLLDSDVPRIAICDGEVSSRVS